MQHMKTNGFRIFVFMHTLPPILPSLGLSTLGSSDLLDSPRHVTAQATDTPKSDHDGHRAYTPIGNWLIDSERHTGDTADTAELAYRQRAAHW